MSQSSELRDLVGEDAFNRLRIAYGGTRIRTSGAIAMEKMAAVIGQEAAEKVASYFSGEHVEIPKRTNTRRARNEAMSQDRENGLTMREIAIKYDLTERAVRSILNGY